LTHSLRGVARSQSALLMTAMALSPGGWFPKRRALGQTAPRRASYSR
jgi:hypothetical protein